MGTLVPDAALIYERSNGVVYARYRDPPHNTIPRWIIGGDPAGVARAQGNLLSYSEWQNLCELSLTYPTLQKLLDKVVVMYYTIKDGDK
tara:strand:- start:987 stop:1253 length:267 start_codon:yes stop_codon:yes gene_type:complete